MFSYPCSFLSLTSSSKLAPCSNWSGFFTTSTPILIYCSYYASKPCTYTDSTGRSVAAPRSLKTERPDQPHSLSTSDQHTSSGSHLPSSSAPNQFRIHPNQAAASHFQADCVEDDYKHTRKRFRNGRGNPMPIEDLVIEGPISDVPVERPHSVDLDHALTRELTNRKYYLDYFPDHSCCT